MLTSKKFWFILFLACAGISALAQKPTASETQLRKQADKHFSNSNFVEATPLYSQLLSLFPHDALLNYRYGVSLIEAGKEKTPAVVYLDFATKHPPVPEDAWLYLGKAHMAGNNYTRATEAFNKYKSITSPSKSSKAEIDLLIANSLNAELLSKSRKDIAILNSKEIKRANLQTAYDYSESAGKFVATAAQFLTTQDKDKQINPVMFITKDGQSIYYSSYGRGGSTGKDIYMVRKMVNGQWGTPENLGVTLNSVENEEFPYLDRDGRTLYFSSRGHNSIGGYDIFKSEYDYTNNQWSVPQNLGIPINTTDDDLCYVPTLTGDKATYCTAYESNHGSVNLREISLGGAGNRFAIISGTYFSLDQATRRDARISVLRSSDNAIVNSVRTDPKSGKYELVLPPGNDYTLIVEGGSYLPHAEQFSLPDLAVAGMRQEVKLNKDKEREQMTVSNFFTPISSKTDEPVLAFNNSPTNVSTSTIYSSSPDSSKLIPVQLDDKTVYINDPKQKNSGPDDIIPAKAQSVADYGYTEGIYEPGTFKDLDSDDSNKASQKGLPSITLKEKDKYDPTLETRLSEDELRQIEEEKERAQIIEEEEKNPSMLIDFNIDNDELAQIALNDAQALQEESERMKQNAARLKTNAALQDSLASTLEAEYEILGKEDAARKEELKQRAAELRDESYAMNKQASDLQLQASIKMDESRAATRDADAIMRSSGKNVAALAAKSDGEAMQKSNKTNSNIAEIDPATNIDLIRDDSANEPQTDLAENKTDKSSSLDVPASDQPDMNALSENSVPQIANDSHTNEEKGTSEGQSISEDPGTKTDLGSATTAVIQNETEQLALENRNEELQSTQTPAASDENTIVASPTKLMNSSLTTDANFKNDGSSNAKQDSVIYTNIDRTKGEDAVTFDLGVKDSDGSKQVEVRDSKSSAALSPSEENKTHADLKESVYESDSSLAQNSANPELSSSGTISSNTVDTEIKQNNKGDLAQITALSINDNKEADTDLVSTSKETSDLTPSNKNSIQEQKNVVSNLTVASEDQKTIAENSITDISSNDQIIQLDSAGREVHESKVLSSSSKNNESLNVNDGLVTQVNPDSGAGSNSEPVYNLITEQDQNSGQNSNTETTVAVDNIPESNEQKGFAQTFENKTAGEQSPEAKIENTSETINPDHSVVMSETGVSKVQLREKYIIPSQQQESLDPEAKVVYEAYENNVKRSDALFNMSRTLQDRILEMPRSPERDSLVEVSNAMSRQSTEQYDVAQSQLEDAKQLDPKIADMLVLSNAPISKNAEPEMIADVGTPASRTDDSSGNDAIQSDQENTQVSKIDLESKISPAVTDGTMAGSSVAAKPKSNVANPNEPLRRAGDELRVNEPETNEEKTRTTENRQSDLGKNENDYSTGVGVTTSKQQEEAISSTDKSKSPGAADINLPNIKSTTDAEAIDSGIDVTHPRYEAYREVQEKITEKQVETINLFAEGVNLNKLSVEEKQQQISLLDSANSISDTSARETVLQEAERLGILSAEHQEQSKVKLNASQAKTHDVKSLTSELQKIKNEITLQPTAANQNTDQENASSEGFSTGANQQSLIEKTAMAKTSGTAESKSNILSSPVTFEKAELEKLSVEMYSIGRGPAYNEVNPIPLNPGLPEGLVFKVQIGAFRKPIPDNTFKNLQPVSAETTRPGWLRYCVGLFKTFEPANLVKKELRKTGYKDAFVVAYLNGKRISLQEANSIINRQENQLAYSGEMKKEIGALRQLNVIPAVSKTGPKDHDEQLFYGNKTVPAIDNVEENLVLQYSVQVGVYRTANPPAILSSLEPIYSEALSRGLYRFTSGRYENRSDAEAAKSNAINQGIKDAFVVAVKGSRNVAMPSTVSPRTSNTENRIASSENTIASDAVNENVKNNPLSEGVRFKVQLGAFRQNVPFETVDAFLKVSDKGIVRETDERGLNIFYAGDFSDFESARLLKEEVVIKGVSDAFVVAIQGGKRIPLTDVLKEIK